MADRATREQLVEKLRTATRVNMPHCTSGFRVVGFVLPDEIAWPENGTARDILHDLIASLSPPNEGMREALEVADYLIDQRDEPWPGPDGPRVHYWRDKAIAAANRLRAALSRTGEAGK